MSQGSFIGKTGKSQTPKVENMIGHRQMLQYVMWVRAVNMP